MWARARAGPEGDRTDRPREAFGLMNARSVNAPHRVTRTHNVTRYAYASESRTNRRRQPPSRLEPAEASLPPKTYFVGLSRRTTKVFRTVAASQWVILSALTQGHHRSAAAREVSGRDGRGRPCSYPSAVAAAGRFAPTRRGAQDERSCTFFLQYYYKS